MNIMECVYSVAEILPCVSYVPRRGINEHNSILINLYMGDFHKVEFTFGSPARSAHCLISFRGGQKLLGIHTHIYIYIQIYAHVRQSSRCKVHSITGRY